MQKSELQQIYYINREIANLENMIASSDSEELREERQKRVAELSAARERVERFISTIPDSLTRQIVELRCVKCYKWCEVAKKVGGGNTADGVRKAFNRYLKANNIF